MPFVLLDVSSESALDALRRNPVVKVLWIEASIETKHLHTPSDQKEEMRPLLIEPANEQALALLRQLERMGIIRILPSATV